ncbi:hypothetical protein FS837_003083 [Tulasnella sp. UAMH 9824]|nr:hypothetical protein FS837_003083 [Tulasnella sp. UAMH 9824]
MEEPSSGTHVPHQSSWNGFSRERMETLYSARMVSRTWRDTIDSTPSGVVSDNLPLHVNSTAIQRKLDLVSMEEEQITAQQLLDVLASAPLLEHLELSRSTLDHHPQSLHGPPTIIQLPALKIIRFQGINTGATVAILSSIQVPNCTSLAILGRFRDTISAPSFPEPALSHFSDFQRRTLSANNISTIYLTNYRMAWECLPTSPDPGGLEFDLNISYDDQRLASGGSLTLWALELKNWSMKWK